jgi:hypothetical protein
MSWRTRRRALTTILAALTLAGAAVFGLHKDTHTVMSLDWESGTNSAFSNLECAHPETQFAIVKSPVRAGRYAARFSETGADKWLNGDVRCLDGAYDTGETVGDDYYFGFSIYIPRPGLSTNLVWELHQPRELYSIPGCGVAPFALMVEHRNIAFRALGGDCQVGKGPRWKPDTVLRNVSPYGTNTWIDFVVHIRFREDTTGGLEVWSRKARSAWTTRPQLSRKNVSTIPYCTARGVKGVKLYTELGLYPGSSTYHGSDMIYIDGYRRGTSFADVAPANPSR